MGLLMEFVQTVNDGLNSNTNTNANTVDDPIWDDFKEVYRETTGKEVSEGTTDEDWGGDNG